MASPQQLPHDSNELANIYGRRFDGVTTYRDQVWKTLIRSFFSSHINQSDTVLDLGCGYGEFINNIVCRQKYGMDLNPRTKALLDPGVAFLEQDCSRTWPLPDNSLDVVFTSNFFEHLPDKQALSDTLAQAHRCLRRNGRLIAMGPNIKYTRGAYWDFYDHYLPLTELSLKEVMEMRGFQCGLVVDRFLPYTMVNAPRYPVWMLALYLKLSPAWRFFGQQFLVVGTKG